MLKDCNRPLGRRGRKQVLKMSKYLVKHIKKPDQIITSPASRAFYTALFMADAWDIDENNLILNDALYHADRQTLLNIITVTFFFCLAIDCALKKAITVLPVPGAPDIEIFPVRGAFK